KGKRLSVYDRKITIGTEGEYSSISGLAQGSFFTVSLIVRIEIQRCSERHAVFLQGCLQFPGLGPEHLVHHPSVTHFIVIRGILIRVDTQVIAVRYSKLLNGCRAILDLVGQDLEVLVSHAYMQRIEEHGKVVPVRMLLPAHDKG